MPLNVTWEPYGYVNITSGFVQALDYFNDITEGLFGIGLLFSVFMVFFFAFVKFGEDKAFLSASFITMILAGLLRATELVADQWFILFMFMTAVGALLSYLNR